ncbi:UNVERIFIED_CONTAM: fructose PTS transporter subunit IIA, partial [Escherichia coli]
SEELISTDLLGETQGEVIDELIQKFEKAGILHSKEEYKKAILEREAQSSTGLGMNIALPHGKSNAVKRPAVAFGIKRSGVDWNSLDGTDAKLIFMIAVPEQRSGDAHLKILQMLSRKLMDENFRDKLLEVNSKSEAIILLDEIQ